MKTPLKIAFQMDPVGRIQPKTDTTFLLAMEAQRRGHQLFHYTPDNLRWDQGKVRAWGQPMYIESIPDKKIVLGQDQDLDLSTQDILFMRQDPPFDMAYITATHLLDRLPGSVWVMNHPTSVRNAPEKLLPLQFAHLMPPTLLTRSLRDIEDFQKKHGKNVLKRFFAEGVEGIVAIEKDAPNLGAALKLLTEQSCDPVMVQKYIPEILLGDKRIILFDGEAIGAVNRIPPAHDFRANLHIGGTAHKTEMTSADLKICAELAPYLKEHDLTFVGIDVVHGFLTEINVTSPTGLNEINALEGIQIERSIWDRIEAKLITE